MSAPDVAADEVPTADDLGQSYAALIGGQTWEIDNPDILFAPLAELPEEIPDAVPVAEAVEDEPAYAVPVAEAVNAPEVPPTHIQILEAMFFIGGSPLSGEMACQTIRGLTPEQFREAIDVLNRVYRVQNRPYMLTTSAAGWQMSLRPRFRGVREKLFGGPRQVRLSQPMIDTLALVAYRQPVGRMEVDTVRGVDSSSVLRQLVRLGLIAVVQRADATSKEVLYGTTPRFLEVFGLRSVEELPKAGDPQRI